MDPELKPLNSDRSIGYARIQLSLDEGDLDCAGWALQKALASDPDNAEVEMLLNEVIARINHVFDSGELKPIFCHIALGRESPSPYVRAMEKARSKQ